MRRSTTTRRLGTVAVAALTALGLVATAGPAQAGSMFFSKSSGRLADIGWLEVGTLPGVAGNAHTGNLYVDELGRSTAYVFGFVTDWECPEGVLPEHGGGGHGEEPTEGGCEPVGERFVDGGDVTFTMDKKLTSARLTGTLVVSDHGGEGAVTPPVDITLTGTGSTYTSKIVDSGSFEGTTYTYRYTFTGRQAVVSGRIGAMVFDDEPGETSTASIGSYRSMSRDRTR